MLGCGGRVFGMGLVWIMWVIGIGQGGRVGARRLEEDGFAVEWVKPLSGWMVEGGEEVVVAGEGLGVNVSVWRVGVGENVGDGVEMEIVGEGDGGEWIVVETLRGVGSWELVVWDNETDASFRFSVSYAPPTLSTASPSYLLHAPNQTYQKIVFGGSNLFVDDPLAGDSDNYVIVGGEECVNVTVEEIGVEFSCWGRGEGEVVEVWVGGVGGVEMEFVVYGAPSLTYAFPSLSLPTRGGVEVEVFGEGWRGVGDVVDVKVEGESVEFEVGGDGSGVVVLDSIPSGVGVVGVAIELATGAQTPNTPLLTYSPPHLLSIHPTFLLYGSSEKEEVVVCGEDIAGVAGVVVSVGGFECGGIVELNSSCVSCEVNTTMANTWPEVDTVVVRTASGSHKRTDLLDTAPPVRILRVDPAIIWLNTRIQLSVTGLGATPEGTLDAVIVGEEECERVLLEVVGSGEWVDLSCSIPGDHASLVDVNGPSTLSLTIHTVATSSSPAVALGVRGRTGNQTAPTGRVTNVVGVRLASASELVRISWEFPLQSEEAEVARSFRIYLERVDDEEALVYDVLADNSFFDSQDGIASFQTEVSVGSRQGYNIRIAPLNAAEVLGLFTSAPFPAYEGCDKLQFLHTAASSPAEILCYDCPQGAICESEEGGDDDVATTDDILPQAGYWRLPWVKYGLGFSQCRSGEACLEGDRNASHNCARDRVATSTLCERCDDGYFSDGVGCVECPAVEVVAATAALCMILVVALFLCYIFRNIRSLEHPPELDDDEASGLDAIKVLYSFCQTMSLLITVIKAPWPSTIASYATTLDAATMFGTGHGLSIFACLGLPPVLRGPVPSALLITFALPSLLILASVLFWVVAGFVCSAAPDRSPFIYRLSGSAVIVALLTHATIVRASAKLLSCAVLSPQWQAGISLPPDVDDDSDSLRQTVMQSFPDVPCAGPEWEEAQIVGGIVLAAFGLGLPALIATSLYLQQNTLETPSVMVIWGAAFNGYRDGAFLWEGIVLLNKVVLVCLSVFLSNTGPIAQLAVAIVTETFILGLHTWWKPFSNTWLNALEATAHVTASVSMGAALFLLVPDLDGTVAISSESLYFYVVIAVILVNAIYLFTGTFVAAYLCSHRACCPKLKRKPSRQRKQPRTVSTKSTSKDDIETGKSKKGIGASADPNPPQLARKRSKDKETRHSTRHHPSSSAPSKQTRPTEPVSAHDEAQMKPYSRKRSARRLHAKAEPDSHRTRRRRRKKDRGLDGESGKRSGSGRRK